MTPKELLDLPMTKNDSGASTVRGYLVALLATVWTEGGGFSGKRPFGYSGWESDLYIPLIRAGVLEGKVDEDGYLDTITWEEEQKGNALIAEAIKALDGSEPA